MQTIDNISNTIKKHLVIREDEGYRILRISDSVIFYPDLNTVYALDHNGKEHPINEQFDQLKKLLDPSMFFAATQTIINANFIESFQSYKRKNLLIHLSVPAPHPVIIEEKDIASFIQWISHR